MDTPTGEADNWRDFYVLPGKKEWGLCEDCSHCWFSTPTGDRDVQPDACGNEVHITNDGWVDEYCPRHFFIAQRVAQLQGEEA